MKKELLAPAGNMEALKQAIHNGCDAVYLGGKKFGARAYSENFSEEELVKAIKYCHLYGVKIYVTVNTLIYEHEFQEVISYIRFLHQNQVDAVILQDLGLVVLVHQKFPHLEIHASTQMHTHNEEQLKLLESLGVKRVVFARELSLAKINQFSTTLELEVFIHGALCICYSGQCLFSSLLFNRSGNRGCCAGICRLPFSFMRNHQVLKTKGNYLLSPKELNTLDHFSFLKDSNVTSFKIEGRMKSPEYVGYVTRLYRRLLDGGEKITEEEKKNLNVLFNREFTKGYLFSETNDQIINIKTPNHQGILLGEILEIKKEKIKIKLIEDLEQNDGIRFKEEDKGMRINFLYDEKGLLIHKASKGDIVYVLNKVDVKKKGEVLKTIDSALMATLNHYEEKKIQVDIGVNAILGKALEVWFKDQDGFQVFYTGKVVLKALSMPTDEEIIKEKIGSLGNTPFVLRNFSIQKDSDIFLPMSELKKCKQILTEDLISKRENIVLDSFVEEKVEFFPFINEYEDPVSLHVSVLNEEQLVCCLHLEVQSIYVADRDIYQKYKDKGNVFLKLERVMEKFDDFQGEKLLVGETGAFFKYKEHNELVTDYYFNVVNASTFCFLSQNCVKRITLSIENKFEDVKNILKQVDKNKIEFFLYGRPEVMVMKYCPLHYLVNPHDFCRVCKDGNSYALKDSQNRVFPIISNAREHITHLLDYKEIDSISSLEDYVVMGIRHFRLAFYEETPKEIESIICKIYNSKIFVNKS